MLLIEGLRSLQRPTYLQTPIGGHHHQLRSLDLVGQLTTSQPSSRIHCHPHHRAEKDKFKSNPATPLMISYHQHLRIINFQIY